MQIRAEELMTIENELLAGGYRYICGVDEVGRGPLAGPVTCTAVIMDLEHLVEGVNDSKKLSRKQRESLYADIAAHALAVSTISYDNLKIDEMNILAATKSCMRDAVMSLEIQPEFVLVDAVKLDIPFPMRAVIHGDELSYSIAAASIIAKVTRDGFMKKMAEAYPGYDFENNMGYGTAKHITALRALGATPIHRNSFIGGIMANEQNC